MSDAISESDRNKYGCPACGESGYYHMYSGPRESKLYCSSCKIGYIVLADGITESENGKLVEHPFKKENET